MSSLYDSLPITSCCRTVCEAMGVDCGDAPAPANEAVLAMCDRAFENIPGNRCLRTAVFLCPPDWPVPDIRPDAPPETAGHFPETGRKWPFPCPPQAECCLLRTDCIQKYLHS